jgi:hypothetical protein
MGIVDGDWAQIILIYKDWGTQIPRFGGSGTQTLATKGWNLLHRTLQVQYFQRFTDNLKNHQMGT